MENKLWITEFDPEGFENFIINAYKNDNVIFHVNYSEVPIEKTMKLIPIIEKYRPITNKKLIKTIVYVESRIEKWIAKALLKVAKPERPVEFVIKKRDKG